MARAVAAAVSDTRAPAGAGRHGHRQVAGLPGAGPDRRRAGGGLHRDPGAAAPARRPRPAPAGRRGRAAARPAADLRGPQGPPPLPLPGQTGGWAGGGAGRPLRRRRAAACVGWARPAGWASRSSGCATGPRRPTPATGTSSTRASTTAPGGWSRCRPASASAPCKCPFGTECFAEASRARAREVDIVVTNHSLLAFDMLAGRHIIPPHQLLVVDEAHELADRVTSATQAELTPELIDRAARRSRSLVDGEAYERLVEAGDALAVGLAQATRRAADRPACRRRWRGVDPARRRRPARAGPDRRGQGRRPRPGPQAAGQGRACPSWTRPRSGCWPGPTYDVVWVERDDRRRGIVVAPLSVAGTLREYLYDDRTVVATSATLALGGRFDTIARSLGLRRVARGQRCG